jgi:hypothetical protein
MLWRGYTGGVSCISRAVVDVRPDAAPIEPITEQTSLLFRWQKTTLLQVISFLHGKPAL